MVDLDHQLQSYSMWLAERADLRADEFASANTFEVEPSEPDRRPSQRWLLGAAASIVVVIGLVALAVLRDDKTVTIDDGPAPITAVTVAPTTVETSSPSTSAPPSTVASSMLRPGEPVVVDAGVFDGPHQVTILPWDEGFLVVANMAPEDEGVAPSPFRAVYTTDGSVDSETQFELPVGWVDSFQVSDGLLVALTIQEATTDVAADDPLFARLTIMTTPDLVEWQSSDHDLLVDVADTERDRVDAARIVTQFESLAPIVVGDRWYSLARSWENALWEHLLPPEVRTAMATAGATSYQPTEDGIILGAEEPVPGSTSGAWRSVGEWTFTWDELGLDGDPSTQIDNSGPGLTLIGGDIGGSLEMLEPPEELNDFAQILRLADTVVFVGSNVHTSPDGREWSEVAQPRGRTALPIVAGDNLPVPSGVEVIVLESDGELTTDDQPDATWPENPIFPTGYSTWPSGSPSGYPREAVVNSGLVLYETVDDWRIVRLP